MDKFNKFKETLASLEDDAKKFYEKDNAAAGTRLRNGMQDLKELAHEIRKEVQEMKNSKKDAK